MDGTVYNDSGMPSMPERGFRHESARPTCRNIRSNNFVALSRIFFILVLRKRTCFVYIFYLFIIYPQDKFRNLVICNLVKKLDYMTMTHEIYWIITPWINNRDNPPADQLEMQLDLRIRYLFRILKILLLTNVCNDRYRKITIIILTEQSTIINLHLLKPIDAVQ